MVTLDEPEIISKSYTGQSKADILELIYSLKKMQPIYICKMYIQVQARCIWGWFNLKKDTDLIILIKSNTLSKIRVPFSDSKGESLFENPCRLI